MRLRLVRAHVGVSWVQQGVRVFWRQPWPWRGLFSLTMAVMSVLTLVPPAPCGPGAGGAAHRLAGDDGGRSPGATKPAAHPTVLLMALRTGRQRLRALGVLGVLYAVGFTWR